MSSVTPAHSSTAGGDGDARDAAAALSVPVERLEPRLPINGRVRTTRELRRAVYVFLRSYGYVVSVVVFFFVSDEMGAL
jgi:hypothetical protein